MALYAMGDLHFSGIPPTKPMDVFDPHWKGHRERILQYWSKHVSEEDIVVLVGDISWAIHLEEALVDLQAIASCPGRIVMIRGNHDYWWSSKKKMRAATQERILFLQADSVLMDGIAIAGTRGYLCPGDALFQPSKDQSIYERELQRFEMALASMPSQAERKIALLHYPPFTDRKGASGFTELLEAYDVDHCIFGHLHTFDHYGVMPTQWGATQLHLVSSNYIDFALTRIDL